MHSRPGSVERRWQTQAMSDLEELRERVEALEAVVGARACEHARAERLDIVERDGTIRLAAANGPRSPDAVVDNEVIAPGRERPGLIFFNDEGDECGGLTWGGKREDGFVEAYGGLTIDRFKNDQIVALGYDESNGSHEAGLRIVDRPEMSLVEAMSRRKAIDGMPHGEERQASEAEFNSTHPWGQQRLFVGLARSGDSVAELRDGSGRPRLRLVVMPGGAARIDFLDEAGAVVRSLGASER